MGYEAAPLSTAFVLMSVFSDPCVYSEEIKSRGSAYFNKWNLIFANHLVNVGRRRPDVRSDFLRVDETLSKSDCFVGISRFH